MSKFTDEWGHFTQMPECVIERTAELGSDAIFLFMYFRFRTNKKRGCAFPKYKTMCQDIGWGQHRIKNAIEKLEEAHFLKRRKRYGKSTEYFLTKPVDMAVLDQDTASIAATAILEEKENETVLPLQQHSIATTAISVLPPTQQDLDSVKKTEFKQTELKDSRSLSQDEWVQALIAIKQDYYRGRPTAFDQYWGGTGFAGRQDSVFRVSCSEDQQEWLTGTGKKIAENMLVGVLGERVEVEFVSE